VHFTASTDKACSCQPRLIAGWRRRKSSTGYTHIHGGSEPRINDYKIAYCIFEPLPTYVHRDVYTVCINNINCNSIHFKFNFVVQLSLEIEYDLAFRIHSNTVSAHIIKLSNHFRIVRLSNLSLSIS